MDKSSGLGCTQPQQRASPRRGHGYRGRRIDELMSTMREAEKEAEDLHVQAQELNKRGEYENAVLTYRQYRKRDDDAIELALLIARLKRRRQRQGRQRRKELLRKQAPGATLNSPSASSSSSSPTPRKVAKTGGTGNRPIRDAPSPPKSRFDMTRLGAPLASSPSHQQPQAIGDLTSLAVPMDETEEHSAQKGGRMGSGTSTGNTAMQLDADEQGGDHTFGEEGEEEEEEEAADGSDSDSSADVDNDEGPPSGYRFTALFPPLPGSTPRERRVARLRCLGAVLGAVVGDAAATSVQWVYDPTKLDRFEHEQRQRGHEGLEFMDPPANEHFTYEVGRNSPYGEQALVLLQSLAKDGKLDTFSYARRFAAAFGGNWHARCNGYRDASCKGFLRNWALGKRPPESGANDKQINCVTRLAPLLAAFSGVDTATLHQVVEQSTRVTQNTPEAVAWGTLGAYVLDPVLTRGTHPRAAVRQALQRVEARVAQADTAKEEAAADALYLAAGYMYKPWRWSGWADVGQAVDELGKNCHTPNSYQTPVHAVLHHLSRGTGAALSSTAERNRATTINACSSSSSRDANASCGGLVHTTAPSHMQHEGADILAAQCREVFVACMRAAMRQGGCCASRCGVIGALLGGYLAGILAEAAEARGEERDEEQGEPSAENGGARGGMLEADEEDQEQAGSHEALALAFMPREWKRKALAYKDARTWARAILVRRIR